MFALTKAIIVSGALIYGAANIDPVSTDSVLTPAFSNVSTDFSTETVSSVFVFAPDHNAPDTFIRDGSQVEANMEQATEYFDDFFMQIPGVVFKKLESVMKYGMKAAIMQDAETKQAEEKMIGSLVGALKSLGDAMSEDMVQSIHNARS
jgi:hypothetical protein